jgi:phospholipase C
MKLLSLAMLQKLFAGLAACLLLQPFGLVRAQDESTSERDLVNKHYIAADHEPPLSQEAMVQLLQKRVKYVFVLYQENRSFDSYFGTFPGADGLFSHPATRTPGFTQQLVDTNGATIDIQPFRIGPSDTCPNSKVNGVLSPTCFAADTDDIDHSHPRMVAKMDIQPNNVPLMDKFAAVEELKYWTPSATTPTPSLQAKQMGELAMAYEDCDTIPLLWAYADKFVLFDHIFQTMTGPSTPGNLAIIGAQAGQTQWALHPNLGYTDNGGSLPGVPLLNDSDPFWGSPSDTTPAAEKMPVNPSDFPGYGTEFNLTYATLPLTLAGRELKEKTASDRDAASDLADVQDDIEFIDHLHQSSVPFAWYEEGFDKEVTDPNEGPVDANGTHASYITHHNGPQYFGYISNNPEMSKQLHGLGDFFSAVENRTLPKQGGVFFVKGGYTNLFSLKPGDPDSTVQKNFLGDDDHPAYSDAQISEAMVAEAINRIAESPYWNQSAIIITWDDSEGDYDHVQPPIRTFGPDNSAITNGPRVPFIVISPYARTHHIAHAQGSQSSVVKFIDAVFNLPPLALLPDELEGRQLGEQHFGQKDIGPEDAITPGITDLLDAFSPSRLMGKADPLPPYYATVSEALIQTLPTSWGFGGCKYLGITTTDRELGITNPIPSDFNPRPKTNKN